MVKINTKARLHNIDDIFVFVKQCHQVYYTNTPSFKKECSRVDFLSVVKTKLKGLIQVVQDGNDVVTAVDDAFQLVELVDPYWVAPFTDLEENSIFCITENTFVDVIIEDLNDLLRTSGHT